MKKLIVSMMFLATCFAVSACEKKTTVIQQPQQPKEEEPGMQIKVKSGESGTEVEVEGKVEDKK